MKLFIPKSLLGRYVVVATTIFVVLVIAAILGWVTVQRGVEQHHSHIKVLGDLEVAIHDYTLDFQGVKYATLEYMIQPDKDRLELYKHHLEIFNKSFIKLDSAQQKRLGNTFNKKFEDLKVANKLIKNELSKVIKIRQSAEQTFPFTRDMLLLAESNSQILALINRVVSKNSEPEDQPSESVKLLFNDIKYAWLRLMAEFRLLVSVRFGIFTGHWQQAFYQRVYNIDLQINQIKDKLKIIKQKQLKTNFVVANEIDQLLELTEKSFINYHQAISLLGESDWRQDLVLLSDKLRPAFNKVDESIKNFQEVEEHVWTVSMAELTVIAKKLSSTLWLILLICSLLILLGYYMFSKAILSPIKNIAQALKDEANGINTAELNDHNYATEISDLSDSFKIMRKQVNSRQQRLVTILDNAAEAIITIDSIGVVETFNAAAEHLFGYKSSEILGESILMLIKQDERQYYQQLFLDYQQLINTKHELDDKNYEIEILCKCEKLLPAAVKFSKTIIDGKMLFTGLIIDITERRENESERQQHLAEMAHIGRLSIMGEMAAGMAHELNQPLAAMSLYLQGSLRECDPQSDTCTNVISAVQSAIDQVDRASAIIRTMRTFVHRESFHLDLVDINELIKRSVKFVLFSQQRVSPQPSFKLSQSPVMVKVDALQIEQVLVNLIRNAFDAQVNVDADCRKLEISSELDENGFASVSVVDAGEGVAKENIDKIFNTYFTTKADGLGMGLSICRSIIEEHDGILWYRPGLENGSQFCFILPCELTDNDNISH